MEVPSTKPYFSDSDIESISKEIGSILKSGRLILGPYTQNFERNFRDYIGVKHAVAVNSCTAALEITLRYFNIEDREVIVPTNTFIATSNAVLFSKGFPVLAGINPETLCIDPEDLLNKITNKTKGVIVVHIAGLPCPEIESIKNICKARGLFLLEDVAHAHGATINNKKTGSLADAGCFSFYPTKVMTTGTGGMITTNNDELADYAFSLRHYGVGKGLNNIINFGSDWLMDEISALLGIYQVRSLDNNISKRNEIAKLYSEYIKDLEDVKIFNVPDNIKHSYYKYPILLSSSIDKRILVEILRSRYGIEIGSIYDPPCHLQPIYQRLFGFRNGMFPKTEEVLGKTCCLPIYPQMSIEEAEYVIRSLKTTLINIKSSKVSV